ncbi:MAG TPA: cytochrome P450 [Gemmataceae bacterium]|nr:cytochrome P450 [Gemmataceae bacterium]
MSVSQTSPAVAASLPLRALPPGPDGQWLFGSLRDFRRDILGFYTHCAKNYGDIVPYRLGFQRLCLLNHPDFTELVLTTDNKNYDKRTYILKLLTPVLGNGLLTSEGDFWLRQRRLIQPAFHKQRIHTYGNVMVEYTLRMLARWQHGESRDLHADMMRLALEIVGKTLFDADVANDAKEVGDCLEVVMDRFIRRWEGLIPVPDWLPTPANLHFKRTLRQLDAIIYKMIAQRRQSGEDRGDLLSLLLQARDEDDGTGMTDLQLRDEAMTLFLAGHETTANALSWTWYLLAQHPEVETKLLQELDTVLHGLPPTVADLPRLVYCEHVLMEAMRLYPPAYGFGRLAKVDCAIGGYRIPNGTTVILCPWVTHRDARWFDDPLAFRPERWAGDAAKRMPRYAYFPFGGGPRQCIGNAFAMMEATLVLATVAPHYHFTLRPDPPVTPRAVVTLRPAHGIPVVISCR